MSTDDPRLEQALHDAAPTVGTVGVVERVTSHRRRRRRNRRYAAGALALVVLLVVGTVAVLTAGDEGSSPHVAAPGAGYQARIISGDGSVSDGAGSIVTPQQVTLDQDAHTLRPPLLVGANALSSASYDGIEGIDPSHVVRVDGARVVDIVNLKARILSLTEGEGARWALTQNHGLSPGANVPDTFLKRIPQDGKAISLPLPTNTDPVGPIAAVSGAVWVPVRDGVLRVDPNSFDVNHVQHITLPSADARWVAQVGKFAYVTDGNTLRGFDISGGMSDTITFGPEILGLASANSDGRVLLANEQGGSERARVARAAHTSSVQVTGVLPRGFVPTGLAASTTRVWATGNVDGAPAIVLLGDDGVRATIVLENAGDETALVWTGPHTVRAVSGGALYDIALP